MVETNTRTPLLRNLRPKLLIGSTALAVFALGALFPDLLGRLFDVGTPFVVLVALCGFVALLVWLGSATRCSNCRLSLLSYAIGHASDGNWLNWLLTMTKCPKCGHTEGPDH